MQFSLHSSTATDSTRPHPSDIGYFAGIAEHLDPFDLAPWSRFPSRFARQRGELGDGVHHRGEPPEVQLGQKVRTLAAQSCDSLATPGMIIASPLGPMPKPTYQFAVRFEPPSHGHRVPFEVFVKSVMGVEKGLSSLRRVLAGQLAKRRGLPRRVVLEELELHVAPIDRGSQVVPLEVGPGDRTQEGLQYDPGAPHLFWRGASRMISSASRGQVGRLRAPAVSADALAEAAEVAFEHGIALELVERRMGASDWRTIVSLTGAREGLREYAKKRRALRSTKTQLAGQIIELNSRPLRFRLEAKDVKYDITLPTTLREKVRDLWEQHVLVDVEGKATEEGSLKNLRAIDVQPIAVTNSILSDYMKTRGQGGDLWLPDEAREYLDSLRRNGKERN